MAAAAGALPDARVRRVFLAIHASMRGPLFPGVRVATVAVGADGMGRRGMFDTPVAEDAAGEFNSEVAARKIKYHEKKNQ